MRWSTFSVFMLLMVLLSASPASAYTMKSAFVSEVNDIGDYVEHTNEFLRDETIKIYVEMDNVNYDGFTFVDFIFIIKDPKNNFVAFDKMDLRNRDYMDDVYVTYTKSVPGYWVDGKYKVEIFVYDRTDAARIKELESIAEKSTPEELIESGRYDEIEEFFESGDNAKSLGVIKSLSDSKSSSRRMYFWIKSEAIEVGGTETSEDSTGSISASSPKFIVKNLKTDKFKVKPNETVTISVNVENEGLKGTENIEIIINDEKEDVISVSLGPQESKTVNLYTKRELPGTYKITIPEWNLMKLFFVIEPEEPEPSESASSEDSNLTVTAPKEEGLEFYFEYITVGIMLATLLILLLYYRRRKRPTDSIYIPDIDTDIDINQIQSGQSWFSDMMDDQ
ncbi:MAG: hypothetical protein SVM80_08030 [Halobacteriota archaeon]|nr:hypothetical protein [Halobacteriota archaeon]